MADKEGDEMKRVCLAMTAAVLVLNAIPFELKAQEVDSTEKITVEFRTGKHFTKGIYDHVGYVLKHSETG